MNLQPDLFGRMPPTERTKRREAMEACYEAAPDGFKEQYKALLMQFAASGREFTGEMVTDAYKASDWPQPDEWRSTGSIYQKLSRQGVIVKVGYAARNQGSPTAIYKGKVNG